MDVESLRNADLEEVSEAEESESADKDSRNVGKLLEQGVERERDEECGDQGGEEPGGEEHFVAEHESHRIQKPDYLIEGIFQWK